MRRLLGALLLGGAAALAAAAEELPPLPMPAQWIITLASDPRPRVFTATAATPQADGELSLDGLYKLPGEAAQPVKARLLAGAPRRLVMTTPLAAVIDAVETPDGGFKGSATAQSGARTEVLLTRRQEMLALDEDAAIGSAPSPAPVSRRPSTPPAADVPAACAAFWGAWVGTMAYGQVGDLYLRVAEVTWDGKLCKARFSYSTMKGPVLARRYAEFAPGASMAIPCGASNVATCTFRRDGDVLKVSLINPFAGTNHGVFRRE